MSFVLSLVGCIVIHEVEWTDSGSWSGGGIDTGATTTPPTTPSGPASVGEATLFDPQGGGGASGLSVEWGTTDGSRVSGDFDLVYGDDLEERLDRFRVGVDTDDVGWIVDLGPIDAVDAVPFTVDPQSYPTGPDGAHDDLQVVVGHVYLIRTVDADSALWSVVRVTDHVVDDHVTVHWCRSADPQGFVAPRGC